MADPAPVAGSVPFLTRTLTLSFRRPEPSRRKRSQNLILSSRAERSDFFFYPAVWRVGSRSRGIVARLMPSYSVRASAHPLPSARGAAEVGPLSTRVSKTFDKAPKIFIRINTFIIVIYMIIILGYHKRESSATAHCQSRFPPKLPFWIACLGTFVQLTPLLRKQGYFHHMFLTIATLPQSIAEDFRQPNDSAHNSELATMNYKLHPLTPSDSHTSAHSCPHPLSFDTLPKNTRGRGSISRKLGTTRSECKPSTFCYS